MAVEPPLQKVGKFMGALAQVSRMTEATNQKWQRLEQHQEIVTPNIGILSLEKWGAVSTNSHM